MTDPPNSSAAQAKASPWRLDGATFRRALRHSDAPGWMVLGVALLFGAVLLALKHCPGDAIRDFETWQQHYLAGQSDGLNLVFEGVLEDYKANLVRFETNLKLQAIFIVLTILLAVRRSDALNLLGNSVPLRWLHLIAPAMIAYLWLSFGFLLDVLIEGRLQGLQLLYALHPGEWEAGRSLFQDAGFIDGWFASFLGEHDLVGGNTTAQQESRAGTAAFVVVSLGTIVSASHACLLAAPAIACRRYVRRAWPHNWRLAYYAATIVPLLLLISSHWQFAYGGKNPNWIQPFILAATPILTIALLRTAATCDVTRYPDDAACMRRRLEWRHRRLMRGRDLHFDGPRPLVALIGDSLSTGFHVGSVPGMLKRMWAAPRMSWFSGPAGEPSEHTDDMSIAQTIDPEGAFDFHLHANPTAGVDKGGPRSLADRAKNTWQFSHQVDEVLAGRYPDVLALWIGHNNVDWRNRCDPSCENLEDGDIARLADEFAADYARQLRRLVAGARLTRRPVQIVVFGLISFESFFEARAETETRRAEDSTRYPYLEQDYEFFDSMRPEYRGGMVRLARAYDARLEALCEELGTSLAETRIRLRFSPAMSNVHIGGADALHDVDAWHPSLMGHGVLATAALPAFEDVCDQMQANEARSAAETGDTGTSQTSPA